MQVAAVGLQEITGDADVQFDLVTLDGQGINYSDVIGTGAIVLDPIGIIGTGNIGVIQIIFGVGIGSSFMAGELDMTNVELNDFMKQTRQDIDEGFLNENEFGEEILYDYNDGSEPQPMSAIVDDEYFTSDPQSEIGVMSSQPFVIVATNKFKLKPDEGHTMKIRGMRFKVMREEPDGTGISMIYFHYLK